jgi:glycosyltransferase involved in cell wall biosynthesis
LEIRDLWPEFAIDMGVLRNATLIRASRWLERFLYRRARHIVVNSPAYLEYLVGCGVGHERITVIANGVDVRMFKPGSDGRRIREELRLGGRFVVTYAGALGMANAIPTVLRAAARLRDNPRIQFLLVGDGKERPKLQEQAAELRLNNVIFAGCRPKADIPEVLAASDACVATLRNIRMFRTTYPNKVFDYMAAGRPTILAIDGVIRDVIESAKAGIFVPPEDDMALAQAVNTLAASPEMAREMGEAARSYVEKHFDRNQQASQFADLLERCVAAPERV